MTIPAIPSSEVTPIPDELSDLFARWLRRNAVRDLDASDSFYDYRGAFMAGVNRGKAGHWPDTFEQHGHPTFSVESKYALPSDPTAGHWDGDIYIPPQSLR